MVLLLELARGLAALWVFFFHVEQYFETASPLIQRIAERGWLGVPMFFVISGYVITYSAESNLANRRSPTDFLKARFLRIYPAFWASVAVVLLVPYLIEAVSFIKSGHYTLPDNKLAAFDGAGWLNFLLLTKVFWSGTTDLQAQFSPINSVYWTLAIEFQFYVVVFIALFFKRHYRHVIGAVSVLALALLVAPVEINHGLFIHHWPSFAVGVGIAYLHKNGLWLQGLLKHAPLKLGVVLTALLAIAGFGFRFNDSLFFAACFGAFLWLIAGVEQSLTRIKRGRNKVAIWLLEPWLILGAMSYSVYLLHGKIYGLPNMFVRQAVHPDTVAYGLLTILGTLVLCYPFYVLVEKRFMSKNYKKLHREALATSASQPNNPDTTGRHRADASSGP